MTMNQRGGDCPKMAAVADLLRDLSDEHDSLDAVVAPLDEAAWRRPTPAAGWDVRDSISHLCFFDEQAALALSDPQAFEARRHQMLEAMISGESPDVALGRRETVGVSGLLERWRSSRATLLRIAEEASLDPSPRRVVWYGPPMSPASFVTARIMETWAHGQDVRDALGLPPSTSQRLRHVLHLAVAARPFTFAVHGVTDPGGPVTVEGTAPDGSTWAWRPAAGSANAGGSVPADVERITGSAVDLALVFTQRRHPRRTSVTAQGATAELWLSIAQAFAGPPTTTAEDR